MEGRVIGTGMFLSEETFLSVINKILPAGDDCPPGVPMVHCFAAPCSVNTCSRIRNSPEGPEIRCENDYCGGCRARFYIGDVEVTSICNSKYCMYTYNSML